ncbi:hypothetical protein V495_02736 [Pseudogymnoascus sp. VKM F-4514 (FW-929)]|nr:hypothetical protein V495_02736 [Pseudogymnoascus sp. VKM F-4514 (FW-929)]KFY62692.1 hypothetical protein V497_02260 [Pseudogymnoascus sp. VKM F-4516 (FW-969)]
MQWTVLLAAFAPSVHAILRFSCSELVTERLDPLVFPGSNPSPHVHQNAMNATMDPAIDLPTASTCTTCTFTQDFSNYWTATLYFQARNGSFIRVKQKGNQGFESAKGGMTVYYSQPYDGSKVTAFKKGFRMVVGSPTYRTAAEASKNRQLTFTCLQDAGTRTGETATMPVQPCPAGIMSNVRFPTCWDGVNLDSADHTSHVAYPSSGTFESGGPCPSTHPVKLPQLFYEVVWDTTPYNDRSLWPDDGSQPFIWSYGDPTGYGTHGDYVFGWKDTSLQQAMDTNCQPGPCAVLSEQSIAAGNACSKARTVNEEVDGWLDKLPGNNPVTGINPGAGQGNPGGGTPTNPGTGTGNGGTAAHYDQCGGQGWTGPTVCASGFTCKVSNQWYSQCL